MTAILSRIFRFLNLRDGELLPLVMASLATFLSIATVVFGRSLSDAILLSVKPPLNIAHFFIYSSLALMLLSIIYYQLLRMMNAARLNAAFLLIFALATLVFEYIGVSEPWYIQAYATFLITAPALGNIIVWNAIGDAFNARQGRRLFYIVCAFSTIGGIVAGACIPFMLNWFGFSSLPVSYCVLFMAATLPVVILHRNRRLERTMLTLPGVEAPSVLRELVRGFDDFISSPLIRNLSVVFFLTAVTTNIIDYSLKDYLQNNYDQTGIAYFYGQFNAISNGFNLVVQLTLLSSFLTRCRTRTLFAVTPIILLIFTFPFLFVYSAVCVVLMRFMDVALRFVIQDAAREIALSPLPRLLRNRAKVIFKGVMNPLGGITAGILLNILAAWLGPQYLPLLIIPVAFLSLYCVRNLNRYCANHLYLALQSSASKEGILQVSHGVAEDVAEDVVQVDHALLADSDENVRMAALDSMLVLKNNDDEALGTESLRTYVSTQVMRDVRLAHAVLVCRLALLQNGVSPESSCSAEQPCGTPDAPSESADAPLSVVTTRQDDAVLSDMLCDIYSSATQRIFKGLMLLHKPEIVETVYQSLASARASTRAQALELLQLTISNVPYGKRILVLCDDVDLADKCKRLDEEELIGPCEALDICRAEDSRRIRRAVQGLAQMMAQKEQPRST